MKMLTIFSEQKMHYVLDLHQDIKLQTPRSTVQLKKLTVHQIIKKISCMLQNQKVHYHVHNNLSHIYPVPILPF